MKCIVTAGPTYEPLDEVRRLTNFSTGKLGIGLANYLAEQGHEVTLLLGYYATYRGRCKAHRKETFTTSEQLISRLQALAGESVGAVFHAAAVSDFSFGPVWQRALDGQLVKTHWAKLPTRQEGLLVELSATPKIIQHLRSWFPNAWLAGWKYEMDGDQAGVLAQAERQIATNKTNGCVVNGRAYGDGYGLVMENGALWHLKDALSLYALLAKCLVTAGLGQS